jgi:hypothetical protein
MFEDLSIAPLDAAVDRVMICGNMRMLADASRLLDARRFEISPRIGVPGDYVIERAFVEEFQSAPPLEEPDEPQSALGAAYPICRVGSELIRRADALRKFRGDSRPRSSRRVPRSAAAAASSMIFGRRISLRSLCVRADDQRIRNRLQSPSGGDALDLLAALRPSLPAQMRIA